MNTEKMHQAQRLLDEVIHQKAGLAQADTRSARAVALSVELAEMANAIRFFKHWSMKPADPEAALEEAADVLHFLLSLANDKEAKIRFEESGRYQRLKTVTGLYTNLMQSAMAMIGACQAETDLDTLWIPGLFNWADEIEDFTEDFLELISRYGISPGALQEEYFRKNEINHQRQSEGY